VPSLVTSLALERRSSICAFHRSTPSRSLPIWNNTNYRSERDATTSERHFHDPTMLFFHTPRQLGTASYSKKWTFPLFLPKKSGKPISRPWTHNSLQQRLLSGTVFTTKMALPSHVVIARQDWSVLLAILPHRVLDFFQTAWGSSCFDHHLFYVSPRSTS
jgi:hypothetical protein